MKYDKIIYVGNCHSITVGILPRRTRVTISQDNSYFFKEEDSQDEVAIKYYESLHDVGLRLHKIDDQDLIQEDTEVKVSTPEEEPTEVEEAPIVEETTEEVVEATTEEDELDQDTVEEEVVINEEIVANTSEATTEEMIEFLDLTYSDSDLYGLAKDAGIRRVQSAWDRSTLISKIINTNPDYVINLIKSNS